MIDYTAQKRRLERAGYIHIAGWVPASDPIGDAFEQLRDRVRDKVEAIRQEPSGPHGRHIGRKEATT